MEATGFPESQAIPRMQAPCGSIFQDFTSVTLADVTLVKPTVCVGEDHQGHGYREV